MKRRGVYLKANDLMSRSTLNVFALAVLHSLDSTRCTFALSVQVALRTWPLGVMLRFCYRTQRTVASERHFASFNSIIS